MSSIRSFKYKQVIVVRTDLKMSTGKKCAQSCHAAVSASESARMKTPRIWQEWYREGQRKIVVKTQELKELLDLKEKAARLGIPHFLVADAGLTELEPGTTTALGIGPAAEGDVDKITGHLKLL